MLNVTALEGFTDNYIWLIHDENPSRVVIVDPGESRPVLDFLAASKLDPVGILLTHHHLDHSAAVPALCRMLAIPAWGPAEEDVVGITHRVRGNDVIELPGTTLSFAVIDIPGHTTGHVAFYGHGALFCGDTLFSAGCGRVFEGTPAQMLHSLDTLARLPDETRVYCGHEYTLANLHFAHAVEPGNPHIARHIELVTARRAAGEPSLPTTLALEKQINPFLRCDEPEVRDAAVQRTGRTPASRLEVFAVLRRWKDEFTWEGDSQ